MKSPTRSNPFRVFRHACAVVATCLFFLASCSKPPTLESVGGVVLEFAVDETDATQPPSKEVLARSVNVIRKRLDPRGVKGVTVRVTDEGRLEVGLPGANANERKHAIALITRLGSLEFAVMANPHDHRSLISNALAGLNDKDEVEIGGKVGAAWHLPELQSDGQPVDLGDVEVTTRQVQRGDNPEVRQYLVIRDRDNERVTGQYLKDVRAGIDEGGSPCINLTFDKEGARRVYDLTRRNCPAPDGYRRRLAIIFDGRIHSAPILRSAMSDRCQMTGHFSPDELQNLVAVWNSGVLEIPLNPTPVSERVVSAKKSGPANEKK